MPGKLDTTQGGTFISDWSKHRSAVAAADNPATPAITPVLNIARSAHGTDSQIWVCPIRTAGAATIDISLYIENNGSLAAAQAYRLVETKAAMATLDQYKFVNLVAGKYYIIITNIAGGATWDVHIATNCKV